MIYHTYDSYDDILQSQYLHGDIYITDHLNGFDQHRRNYILDHLSAIAFPHRVYVNYALDDDILGHYSNLNLQFIFQKRVFDTFDGFSAIAPCDFKTFVCSFNGSPHVSKQLLTSALHKMGWFDPEHCSKNFTTDRDRIDGNVQTLLNDSATEPFYRKFIINDQDDKFYNSEFGFDFNRTDHNKNIQLLKSKLTGSFVHFIAETVGTTYYPFVTEKFVYSVVTRGLFVAYAQPGWHKHIEKYFGFRHYTRLFDYSFDQIQNPIQRLVAIIGMLSKFSNLSRQDWHDLYLLEQDTIEYNYDHFVSKNYLKLFPESLDILPKPLV